MFKVGDIVQMNKSVPEHPHMFHDHDYLVTAVDGSFTVGLHDIKLDAEVPMMRRSECFHLSETGGPW